MCLFMQGGRHYLFACYSYESLFAWAGMLYCDCIFEYVGSRVCRKTGAC